MREDGRVRRKEIDKEVKVGIKIRKREARNRECSDVVSYRKLSR